MENLPVVAEKLSKESLAKLRIPEGVAMLSAVQESLTSKLAIASLLVIKGQSSLSVAGLALGSDLSRDDLFSVAQATEVQTLFRDRPGTKRKSLQEVVETSTAEYFSALVEKNLKKLEVMSEANRSAYLKKAGAAFIASL